MTPTFAKNRARLLRVDLLAAGFDVSHSLALELVAHQSGFADWNTLVAAGSGGRGARPHLERETYEHTSTTMTLGELRAIIADHPDDTPIYVSVPTEPGSMTSEGLPAGSADVERGLVLDGRPVLSIEATYPSGRYLVSRWLVVKLAGTSADRGAVAKVIDAVEAAVVDLGFRGEREMRNDAEAGTVTWRFKAYEGVPLSAVEEAVRRIVERQNPGGWTLTSE